MSKDERMRLLELCDSVSSGTACRDQVDELESLMLEDASAREIFLNWSAMQVDLTNIIQASHSRDSLIDHIEQRPARTKPLRGGVWFAALAASLFVTFLALRNDHPNDAAKSDRETQISLVSPDKADVDPAIGNAIDGMAVVNRVEDPTWANSARSVAVGDLLRAAHWIELESGVAEIEFGQGAVVVLEGPARFRAKSTSLGVLDYGKLAAVVPPWADGFQIDTPTLEVVDRGTEFVVEVSGDNEVAVGVTKGEVEVFQPNKAGVEKPNHRLFAGDALRASITDFNTTDFDETWHSLSERLPTRPDHTQVEVVAKYRRDYVPGVRNKPMRENNWRYYANYWSQYNDPEGYQELLWDPQRQVFDPNGGVGRTAGGRLHASNFSYRGGHPGQGRDQSKDDLDHYVIAAYQVAKSGHYRIESGWLVRAESRDDLADQAVDLRVWVNDQSDLIEQTCNDDGLLKFGGDMGDLRQGDWIYVAVGPRNVSYNDRFEWDFAIVRTIEGIAL